MAHDPCNPIPTNAIPAGLSLRAHHMAVHVGVGHSKTEAPKTGAVTTIAPSYIGCDRTKQAPSYESWRIFPMHVPPTIELPAVSVPHSAIISVATIPNYSPLLTTDDMTGIQMPDPSGAMLFLFAVLIAWTARQIGSWRWEPLPAFMLAFDVETKARRRHRARLVAPYFAVRHFTP